MKIKAVLFDLDGVLVDATEWHFNALNRALSLFGYTISRYEHLTTYNGLPTRKKLEMLSVEKNFPRGLHSLTNKIKQLKDAAAAQHQFDALADGIRAAGQPVAVALELVHHEFLFKNRRAIFENFLARIFLFDFVRE